MEEPMLEIDDDIEREEGEEECKPSRKCEPVEEAPPALAADGRPGDAQYREERSNQNRIEYGDAEVSKPTKAECVAAWRRGTTHSRSDIAMTMPKKRGFR